MRRRLCRAHQLVAVSQYARDDLLRYLPATPPTEVIHKGVADLSQALVTNVPQLEGLPFFLHISRMSSNKNVESLLELAASWPEQLFVMAGPLSEEVRKHQAYCHQQELRNVLFLTDVSESVKAWLYAHCQVFLFPSLVEGFGLPPIEALYFGKPVVVARRTSLPEICGDAVQYWDDFEPAAMRAAISELLQRIQAGRWSAANARAQAKRYQWSEVTAQYLDLYARGIGRCP
jgi:glycosyltransferase involved in cell wall biosynthesis